MKLQWYGTAALLVYDEAFAIAFDPFLGIRQGDLHPERIIEVEGGTLALVSDVFVTHGHFDHIIQIPALYSGGNAVIHATKTPCETLRNHGVPTKQLDIITPGGYYTVGNFEITARQGRHCQFDVPLVVRTVLRYLKPGNLRHGLRLLRCNKEYPENGEILFYELKSGGKRLQIMGSMGLDGDTEYPTGADLLILPYQGKSKPEQYAASLVERLRPKAVLLDHYDNSFPPMTSRIRTAQFEKLLREKYKIPCRAMERGTTYDMEELTL